MEEPSVTISRSPDAPTVEQVGELRVSALTFDGFDSLSERDPTTFDQWSDLGRSGEAAIVLARSPASGVLVGYAQFAPSGKHDFAIELLVAPAFRDLEMTVASALLQASLRSASEMACPGGSGAGGPDPKARKAVARYWVHHADGGADRLVNPLGFHLERELLQMRRTLPMEGERTDLEVRPFVPGRDEGEWLAVNNRAFSGHPEQGEWGEPDLVGRERQAWFDPAGFLLHETGGRLAGSCWTKVHSDVDPPMGEIYVISVDPDFHGRGLGRALTRAGLDWLADTGIRVGMLYVDSANQAAVSLYRSMGFEDHHVDRAYAVPLGR